MATAKKTARKGDEKGDASVGTGTVRVTLVRSVYGQLKSHRASVRGLGLRRIRDTATLKDTPEVRGMIRAASHLLKVETSVEKSNAAQ